MSFQWGRELSPDTRIEYDQQAQLPRGLFDILKEIIDGEWGPYDDAYYWGLVDKAFVRLGLHWDRQRVWPDEGGGFTEVFYRSAGEKVFDERFD